MVTSDASRGPRELFGRDRELTSLNELTASARSGISGVVVVTGPAGIGKTRLLHEAFGDVPGFTVLRVDGVEPETGLAYSALHRLLAPFLPPAQPLPEPQQRALDTVFGVRVQDVPDPFLVGLATLTVLTDAARRQPLICVIDDVHWLDEPSLLVMAFVARRVLADPIVLAFAGRTGTQALAFLAALPELSLAGLEPEAQLSLLEQHAPEIVSTTARRIADESAGNPLALVEYVRNLSPQELAGEAGLLETVPLTTPNDDLFERDIRALPHDSRLLLTAAALEPRADFERIRRCAAAIGVDFDADPERAFERLASIRPRVTFSHPLVRSAAYRIASPDERRRIHAALADAAGDPVRRAWHLARAADGHDETVARELESAAVVARTRGGHAAESELLGRAAELSADEVHRQDRLLRSATAAVVAGQFLRAKSLLGDDAHDDAPPAELLVRAKIDAGLGKFREAPGLYVGAARALHDVDPAAARDAWHHALYAAIRADGIDGRSTFDRVAAEALESDLAPGPEPTLLDLIAVAIVQMRVGDRAGGIAVLQEAYAYPRLDVPSAVWGLESSLIHLAALEAFDLHGAVPVTERLRERDRQLGALPSLRMIAFNRARTAAFTGQLSDAHHLMREAAELNRAFGGDPRFDTPILFAQALSGQEAVVNETFARIVPPADAIGFSAVGAEARIARGLLHVGSGRYAEATEDLRATFLADVVVGSSTMSLATLVEAAARSGEGQLAERALERLDERASAAATPWGDGLLARAQAIVAAPAEAEGLYERAVARLDTAEMPLDLARARLVYGEWLRRRRRRTDAIEQLVQAHEAFSAMGADGFAERARAELQAAGGRARRRAPETRDDLTAQERQVASGAAAGATNREIATTMFISEATVAYHLRKVFVKLGVSSRRQLRDLDLT